MDGGGRSCPRAREKETRGQIRQRSRESITFHSVPFPEEEGMLM